MKSVRNSVLFALIVSAVGAYAGLSSGKENCQAQAGGTITNKDKRQQALEATRVFEGAAKPVSKPANDSKAISEKGS